jgi:SAM-dependent methyltransferase
MNHEMCCLDVRRILGIGRFFSLFSFSSGDELLETVAGIEIDVDVVASATDLTSSVMSGSLYWLLYVKGYLQFLEQGEVSDDNVYFRYLTRHFDAAVQDPGIADVLSEPEQARERVAWRFRDVSLFHHVVAKEPLAIDGVEPIVITVQEPPSDRATVVFELDSDQPVLADIDGYHRAFAARLFGIPWLPCRIERKVVGDELEHQLAKLARFAIPYNAHVTWVPEWAPTVNLGNRPRTPLLLPADPPGMSSEEFDRCALEALEEARRCGAEFVLLPFRRDVPAAARLAKICEEHYRTVARVEGVGVVHYVGMASQHSSTDASRELPPPEIAQLAIGIRDPVAMDTSGLVGVQSMESILAANGIALRELEAILDFGCGCGRMLAHLQKTGARLYGADYNPYLAEWCKRTVPSVTAVIPTEATPGLKFEDSTFDLIIAVATFTHMDETVQRPWMRELTRVLRPGGALYLSVHGASRAAELAADLHARFMSGQVVVVRPGLSGTNGCAAYHPEDVVRGSFSAGLDVLAYVPGGARDVRQDAVLFRKQTHSSMCEDRPKRT